MDIDYAIRKDEPILTEPSTPAQLALHERWEQSNRLNVMFINTKIFAGICGSVEQHTNIRALLKAIRNFGKSVGQHPNHKVFIIETHQRERCA